MISRGKIFERSELNTAVDEALRYGETALLETCIIGDEVTVAILQGEALPSIRIETPSCFNVERSGMITKINSTFTFFATGSVPSCEAWASYIDGCSVVHAMGDVIPKNMEVSP